MVSKSQLQPPQATIPYGQMNLIINFRTLWLNLAIWTRAFLISAVSGLPNTQSVSDRLYQIPVQISALLQLVFGQEASEKFLNLLSTHIVTMQQLITALNNGDSKASSENTARLYQINQEIATYLEKVNPFWVPPQWANLLDYYVNLTINEVTAMLSGEYATDVQLFDRIQYQTLLIGDYMANGIIQYLSIRGIQP